MLVKQRPWSQKCAITQPPMCWVSSRAGCSLPVQKCLLFGPAGNSISRKTGGGRESPLSDGRLHFNFLCGYSVACPPCGPALLIRHVALAANAFVMHVARQIHTGTRASGPFVRRIEGTWWRQDWQDFQLRPAGCTANKIYYRSTSN